MANDETERLFGYPRTALLGSPVELLIPDRYQGHHPARRTGFLAEPRTRPMGAGLDLWARRRDGSEFPVEISLSPLETDDGVFATAAIRDVTERKRSERELSAANVQLESANRAKDRFLASMSHELRTPLNAILGFTGTLLMELPGPLTEDQRAQLTTVRRSGQHLLSLINDLLDLARIDSGKVVLHPEPVDAHALLDEVAVALRPLADEKGLAIEVPREDRAPTLVCDRRALSQIVINLANNAIKATDAGSVRLAVADETVAGRPGTRFDVIDTGVGISPDEQARLFVAFEQVDTPGSRPFEGTGLGLHISQGLAQLMGGEITFSSEPGSGSTFSVRLPSGGAG